MSLNTGCADRIRRFRRGSENCADAACSTGETRMANMTFYTAAGGAGMFAAGSMNWNWGLDAAGHYFNRVNLAVRQITRSVLRRFVGK